jgi:hypothetical protein
MKKASKNKYRGRKSKKRVSIPIKSNLVSTLNSFYECGWSMLFLSASIIIFLIFDFIGVITACEIQKLRVSGLINCYESPINFYFILVVKLIIFVPLLGYPLFFIYRQVKKLGSVIRKT